MGGAGAVEKVVFLECYGIEGTLLGNCGAVDDEESCSLDPHRKPHAVLMTKKIKSKAFAGRFRFMTAAVR